MFWIVVAAMIAVVGGAIALPLLRGRGERRPVRREVAGGGERPPLGPQQATDLSLRPRAW